MEKEKSSKKSVNKKQNNIALTNTNNEEYIKAKEGTTSKRQEKESVEYIKISDRSFLITLILCIFFGYLGVHRFYAGKVGTGLIGLFTGGLFGIGYIVDIIMITAQSFEDGTGKTIVV